MKLLSTKSMMRYLPPKGTAALARSLVSGCRRVPFPPANTMPSTPMRIASDQALIVPGKCRKWQDFFVPGGDVAIEWAVRAEMEFTKAAVIGTGMMGPGI